MLAELDARGLRAASWMPTAAHALRRGASRMAALTFGEFRLDPINKRLWRGEQPVDLSGVHLTVLCHMAEHNLEALCT